MTFNIQCDKDTLLNSLPKKWEKFGLNDYYLTDFYSKYDNYNERDQIDLLKKEHVKLILLDTKVIPILNEIKIKRNEKIKNLKKLEKQLEKELIKKNKNEIYINRENILNLKSIIKELRNLNFDYVKNYFDYDDIFKYANNELLIKNFKFEPNYIKKIITDCNFLNDSKINDNKNLKLYFKKDEPFFFIFEKK